MIGGGWGAYELEEHEYDGTVARLQNGWDMVGPFREGLVSVMMPELLIHANYGAGPYRREDAHYVYRSLMYERSVFGDAVIPNFELFWQRAMTPDEVMRWLLECCSAGYPSYSVVHGEAVPGKICAAGGVSSDVAASVSETERVAVVRASGGELSVSEFGGPGKQFERAVGGVGFA